MSVIKLRKNIIDIPVENLEGEEVMVLSFDRTDENTQNFQKQYLKILEKIKKAEEKGNLTDKKASELVKEGMDTIFGEGTYDKFYGLTPSYDLVAVYFYEAALIIKKELEKEELEAVERKYLDV